MLKEAQPADTRPALNAVRVNARDTVAVALRDLMAGETVDVADVSVSLTSDIPAHHKFALQPHAAGDQLIRFGEVFARASEDIAAGAHVHAHNAQTLLGSKEDYVWKGAPAALPAELSSSLSFQGFRRSNGRVGTRNEIWVIPTVGCVANVCEQIARRADRALEGSVEAVVAFPHVFGCSQLGDDLDSTRQILAALVQHPNAGGVVLVGLGCENNQAKALADAASDISSDRFRMVIAQQSADEIEDGLAAVQELMEIAGRDERSTCPLSDLVIGLKCGGSDALSGLTANPLLGDVADAVTASGGTAILTEIPEVFGAEHLLMQRAASEEVFNAIAELVNGFKQYFIDHDQPVHENPSPGNKAGGITTLEEKSLGAVQKSGRAIVTDVLNYGERVRTPGLSLLEAPGNDAVSSTALAAAGATLILFTTGRGTPLGFPVPTVKVASNTALAERKPGWIDFDAGQILQAEDRGGVAKVFLQTLADIASGKQTRNEINGERSIAIWKRGVTL